MKAYAQFSNLGKTEFEKEMRERGLGRTSEQVCETKALRIAASKETSDDHLAAARNTANFIKLNNHSF